MPRAGFQHLERGVAPFVVGFVYAMAVLFGSGAVAVIAVLFATSGRHGVVTAIVLALVLVLLLVGWWLFSLYVFAALLIGSDRLGIAKALDPRRLLKLANANQSISLRVGLTYLGALIVLFAVSVPIAVVIPFGGLLVSFGLPAIYVLVVPSLAEFKVEPVEAGGF